MDLYSHMATTSWSLTMPVPFGRPCFLLCAWVSAISSPAPLTSFAHVHYLPGPAGDSLQPLYHRQDSFVVVLGSAEDVNARLQDGAGFLFVGFSPRP